MPNSRKAFEEAIRHFPRWMDIRKRKDTSVGGKLLYSVVKEMDEIQQSLEDYRKDFFIINYIGKEDSVIDYLNVANVGLMEVDKTILLEPKMNLTEDMKTFYQAKEPMALYQDGRLLFRPVDTEGMVDAVYSRNGFTYSAMLEKVHIWNVMDEFALFAGLERQPGEINEELLRRTLLTFKSRTSSTEDGLKNAIINAIANKAKLEAGEISIEKPSENNLFKAYGEFGSVIEELAQLNKDTYRTKKWDESKWTHDFKSLDYVPHKWDAEPKEIQDGVAHNDALKAALLSELEDSESTDVRIDAYEKSDVQINEYIRDKRVEVDIDLKLKKYGNVLKAREVEYKITATEATDLTDSNVYIDCHKVTSGENAHFVADLVSNPAEIADITIQRGKLASGKNYKLRFLSKADFGTMEIPRINLDKAGVRSSLIKEKAPYLYNAKGILANSNVKLHANSTSQLKTSSNIVDTKAGMTLTDVTKDGNLAVDVTGMSSQYVHVRHQCKETSIVHNSEFVKSEGFIINDRNQIESMEESGTVTIELTCSQLYFEIESGNCVVTKTIDGKQLPAEVWFEAKSEQLKFDSAKSVKVVIQKLPNNVKLIVNSIRYARYDVELRMEQGNLIHTPLGSLIPQTATGSLIVTMRSYSGFAPVIEFIHIGATLKNAVYETEVFTADNETYLDVDSNCSVELVEVAVDGSALSTQKNFISRNAYRNTRLAAAYIRIDTSSFASIKRTVPALERFSHQGQVSDWIRLNPGEEIDTISIDGNVRTLLERIRLNDILMENLSDRIYASQKLKGFIVKSASGEKLVTVKRSDISLSADAYTVHGLPSGARGAFILDETNNVESIGESHSLGFQTFYIFPAAPQEHIAYNRTRMIRPDAAGVEIVDMFTPIVPANKLMTYVVDPVTKPGITASVKFEKADGLHNWSLGKKTLSVQMQIDQQLSDNYEVETAAVKKKFILSNNIDLEQDQEINGQLVDIAEYVVIPPADMRVIFEQRIAQPESHYAQEDGFNKLKFSNITMITGIRRENGTAIPSSDYVLLKEEGIIAWKNESLFGELITVEYRYGIPRYLAFTDLERLYELVGYSTEAYRFVFSTHYRGLTQDAPLSDSDIDRLKDVDRAITSSSNPNFRARIDNQILRLSKINEEDSIAVKTGFFYQDGQELYQYNNRNEDILERFSNVELINTKRLEGEVLLSQQSKNYLPGSSMNLRRMGETSRVDFRDTTKVSGLSTMNGLSACDSFNLWNAFEMEIGFKKGLYRLGTTFKPKNDYGYAMIDITPYLAGETSVSMYHEGDLSVRLGRSRKVRGYELSKSVFVEPVQELATQEEFKSIVVTEEMQTEDTRFYLIIKGEGLLDDIVVKRNSSETLKSIHTRNIDKLGFEVSEHTQADYSRRLMFDVRGNRLTHLDVDSEGLIRVGANVDWGLTKIHEFKDSWSGCSLREVELIKDSYLKTGDRPGYIETSAVYVRAKESARSVIFKINEISEEFTSGYNIEVLTSEALHGIYRSVAIEINADTIVIPSGKISNYIKLRVDMSPNKVINNIEAYVEYIETSAPLRIGNHPGGTLDTKVYDTGAIDRFRVVKIDAGEMSSADHITVSMRAAREADGRIVWTDFKEVDMDETGSAINLVEFDGYRYYQARIILSNENAYLRIRNIELEVVK